MLEENGLPTLNNDLDLVVNCGSDWVICGGSWSSTSGTSELELIERPACSQSRSCSIKVRIKNGVSLAGCGSNSAERAGIAWTFDP